MILSIIQFSPVLGDSVTNSKKISSLLDKCEGSDLILLPELSNSGYNFQNTEEAYNSSIEIENSDFINLLKLKSTQYNAGIICGINERREDGLYNSAVFIDGKEIIGKYQKLHLFAKEHSFFKPGNTGLPVFEFRGIKIGILICFDWVFPEVWRNMALQGVDLICHPSNLVLPYAQSVIPSHSIINRVFVALSNRIGTEHNLTFSGNSIVSNPRGEIIGSASKNNEEVLVVEFNPEESREKMITEDNHVFDDRRLDIYDDLRNIKT